jgi:acyl carrier protein
MEVEEAFEVKIPDQQAETMVTVGHVYQIRSLG